MTNFPHNIDAKIILRATAMKVRRLITKLDHCDQTAGVNSWCIGESNRLINDILEYTKESNNEAIMFLS